jgi:hypothetical protein
VSQLLLSRVEVFDAVMTDTPVLVADLDTGEILLASAAADELFATPVKGGLVTKKLRDVLPGLPADYASRPRKTSVIAAAPGGEPYGLAVALTPRQFTGRPSPCVIAVIVEVGTPGPPPQSASRPPEGRDVR